MKCFRTLTLHALRTAHVEWWREITSSQLLYVNKALYSIISYHLFTYAFYRNSMNLLTQVLNNINIFAVSPLNPQSRSNDFNYFTDLFSFFASKGKSHRIETRGLITLQQIHTMYHANLPFLLCACQ